MLPAYKLVIDRLLDIFNIGYNSQRILLFNDVINKIYSNSINLIFGNGFGNFYYKNIVVGEIFTNPHNIVLYLIYTMGLTGFTLFGFFIYLVFQRGVSMFNNTPDILKYYKSCIFIYCAFGMTETILSSVTSSWLIGYVLGLGLLKTPFNIGLKEEKSDIPSKNKLNRSLDIRKIPRFYRCLILKIYNIKRINSTIKPKQI
jgi:O-antigen ligase